MLDDDILVDFLSAYAELKEAFYIDCWLEFLASEYRPYDLPSLRNFDFVTLN